MPGIDTAAASRPTNRNDDRTISSALRMLLPAMTRDRSALADRCWMKVISGTV